MHTSVHPSVHSHTRPRTTNQQVNISNSLVNSKWKFPLPYIDVNAETTLQTDASKRGSGACLIQKGKVVSFVSCALTKPEQNNQNLERGALGTIWGMEKFHYFLYGKEFTLETGQKPLVSIYKKHMIDISPMVQRLIVRSFPCQPFTIVCKKGSQIPVADALSRVTPMDPEENIQLPIIAVNMITTHVLMCADSQKSFSTNLDRIRKSTQQDEELKLSRYITEGFQVTRETCQQIFINSSHRRKCSLSNQTSLLAGTES